MSRIGWLHVFLGSADIRRCAVTRRAYLVFKRTQLIYSPILTTLQQSVIRLGRLLGSTAGIGRRADEGAAHLLGCDLRARGARPDCMTVSNGVHFVTALGRGVPLSLFRRISGRREGALCRCRASTALGGGVKTLAAARVLAAGAADFMPDERYEIMSSTRHAPHREAPRCCDRASKGRDGRYRTAGTVRLGATSDGVH